MGHVSMARWMTACGVLAASSVAAAPTGPAFEVIRLGLQDEAHTAPTPSRTVPGDRIGGINARGQVVGWSSRYGPDGREAGISAWLFDGKQHVRLGLFDSEHGSELTAFSNDLRLNARGHVAGITRQLYSAGGGRSAWVFDGRQTRRIGLVDGEHRHASGEVDLEVTGLNDRGQVIGESYRYASRGGPGGLSAWLFDGQATHRIGLVDGDHTGAKGRMQSHAVAIGANGHAIGTSARYDAGGDEDGRSAWVSDGRGTRRTGLFDSSHTGPQGLQSSEALSVNASGQSIGHSNLYEGRGRSSPGQSAWFDDGSTTRRIGLWDGAHARLSGGAHSEVHRLNDAGQAIGVSWAWNDAAGVTDRLTYSAWLFDGTQSRPLGLTGPEHRLPDGRISSQAERLNARGQVIGISMRNGARGGYDAWWSDGGQTVAIGLTDGAYTSSSGDRQVRASLLNDAGQVVGSSARFHAGGSVERYDNWFYDPATATTHALSFNDRPFDAWYLTPEGTVLGTVLTERNGSFAERLVAWSLGDGYIDLGDAVGAGTKDSEWATLSDGLFAGGPHLAGTGRLKNRELGAYLIRPTTPVPEPATAALWLAGLGLLVLARRGARRSAAAVVAG